MLIKEIIFSILLFLLIYLIIYLDQKLNKKCECDKNISIKIPFIITILTYILYKLLETNIYTYINGFSVIKQEIITDMADF